MSLPKHFMVSDVTGDLFDTRREGWYKRPPIRPNYGKIKCDVKNNNTALKAAIRAKYVWPDSLYHDIKGQWRIVAVDCAVNYDSHIYCDNCYKTIVEDFGEE